LYGVEKAKSVLSSSSNPNESHPGNGYNWKRAVGEQGEVRWVATNNWSGDSADRGGIIAGAKGIVRSGVEKAKGVFSSTPDAKESELTGGYTQSYLSEDQSTGILQGAKEKVLHGVEKAKSVFSSPDAELTGSGIVQGAKEKVLYGVEKAKSVLSSSSNPNEQHPGNSYKWRKTTGDQGQTHWVARNDWSNDSANQQNKFGVVQGAKEKVWEGVEKAKEVFSTTKPTETTGQTGTYS